MSKVGVFHSRFMLALFAAATILLPFNALPYFKNVFREMANEGTFYPLAVAMVLYAWYSLHSKKIYLHRHSSVTLLALFVVWVGISGLGNFLEIIYAFTKGRSGTEKYIFQYVLLLFVVFSSFLIYQLGMRHVDFLLKFRRYVVYSLIPVSLYCIVEILAFLGDSGAMGLLLSINYFIRDEGFGVGIFPRLRSVSGEPSYFAMYLGFVFPWVFSYLITEDRHRWPYIALLAFLVGLLVLTFSRSAYGMIGIQFFLLILGVTLYGGKNWQGGRIILLAVITIGVGALTLVVFNIVEWNDVAAVIFTLIDTESILNMGRYGSQVAAFTMAVDNPIFGVGFGQYGFKMPTYVPDWALASPEIEEWMSTSPDSAWAPALGLYARVAGELGFIGLGLWIALWVSLLISCYRRFKLNSAHRDRCDGIGLALLVSMVGILMSGLNSDSLRFFGYWILLGLCWIYLRSVDAPSRACNNQKKSFVD